jgi:hypothetical protein
LKIFVKFIFVLFFVVVFGPFCTIMRSVVYWSEFLDTGPEVPGSIPCPYQIFCEVGGLERAPLSLVRTIEELLE